MDAERAESPDLLNRNFIYRQAQFLERRHPLIGL